MAKENQSSGIGFIGLLTIAFVVLRLCGVIDWSWWWVLSPLWIAAGVVAGVVSVLLAWVALVFLITPNP